MTSMRTYIEQAYDRGIALSLDGNELVIGGDYTDQFLAWATRHKAELVAELRPYKVLSSLHPWPTRLEALISSACYGTGYSNEQAWELLADDLHDLEAGTLSPAAAKHYLSVCWSEGVRPGSNPYQPRRRA